MVVRRDTVAPAVTCASPPQTFEIYQLGAWVRADVTDATSGPANPVAQGPAMANTNSAGTFSQIVTGTDRAGLRTSRSCAYRGGRPDLLRRDGHDRRHGGQQRHQRHGGP